MKPFAKILLSLCAAGLVGTAIWLLLPRSPKPSTAAPKPAPTVAATPTAPAPAAVAAPVAAPPAPTPERPAEVAATARMYAAHASLRTTEVANPDSETNRQILQTMVGKALRQTNSSLSPVGPH